MEVTFIFSYKQFSAHLRILRIGNEILTSSRGAHHQFKFFSGCKEGKFHDTEYYGSTKHCNLNKPITKISYNIINVIEK